MRNAFLNGYLNETVHMKQLARFVNKDHPHHVCLLYRPLYGLKHAPRVWYLKLHMFLIDNGFTNSKIDTSPFLKIT